MDHPLENLGPERFQHLCQALFVKEFPGTACFPVGQPDGGRDASKRSLRDESEGFTVFQVKFSRDVRTGSDARDWVIDAATGEVDKVKELIKRGAKNYVFATNVSGTSHLTVGSIDRLQEDLSNLLSIPVLCWWRDDINRRLDDSWSIKLRYPEVLSGQDFLHLSLLSTQGDHWSRRDRALRAFLAEQYQEDQEVKFKQVELQNKLLDLFVDLPARIEPSLMTDARSHQVPLSLLRKLTSYHDERYYELDDESDDSIDSGTAALLLREDAASWLKQFVVEGAPGQGKSTLAQYICQVHRIRLLNKDYDTIALPGPHKISPIMIPIKVDLRDLSEWLTGNDPFSVQAQSAAVTADRTLETFLAHLIQNKAGGIGFNVNDLLSIAANMPLFVALDGLDEVADIKRRSDVVSAVTKSSHRLRENCPNIRIMVTSRPAAFANSPGFDKKQFLHLQLGSVTKKQIKQYTYKWMTARGLSLKERSEFEGILTEKLDQPHIRDLSRNPMQLTILLSLILQRGPALPDKRTALYDAYVDLFFSRESTKNHIVRKYLEELKDIHRYLAWKLHSSAENYRGKSAAGRLTSSELRDALSTYLTAELQDTALVDEIFNAMLERVVMIVSRIEGTHEFEVQPLREYFAARYLYDTAPYSPPGKEKNGTKPDRFDSISRNLYWLNVTRFFSGCFSKGELLDLADRLKHLMQDSHLRETRVPYVISAMLLADRVFSQSQRAIIEVSTSLTTRVALRNLAPRDYESQDQDLIRIPKDCGGMNIVNSAFEYLMDKTAQKDILRRLNIFIHANLSIEEISIKWRNLKPLGDQDISRWIWLGGELGCFRMEPPESDSNPIKNLELSFDDVAFLFNSDLHNYIRPSKDHYDKLLEAFLFTAPTYSQHIGVTKPFYLVPFFLRALSHPRLIRHSSYFVKRMKELVAVFVRESSEQSLPDPNYEEISTKCYHVSRYLAEQFDDGSSKNSLLDVLEVAVDTCAENIGEHPAIIMVAINIANQPRGKNRKKILKHALSETNKSLVGRLRYAKSQSKNWGWWKEQLFSSEHTNKFLVQISFWVLAPINLIIENSDDVSALLDALSETEWNRLSCFAQTMHYSSRWDNVATKNKTYLNYQIMPVRFAYMLGEKAHDTHGTQVFMSHFIEEKKSPLNVSQFRQYHAYKAAAHGELPWTTALNVIKETYMHGACYSIDPDKKLPDHVVSEVLAHADDYPTSLWDQAQMGALAKARKKIKAVAAVARKEKWFSN